MATIPEYFIGAGDLKVAPLDADGNPTKWSDVGECPRVEYGQAAEFADNFATGKTGPNLQDLHVLIRRTGTLTIDLKERTAANLALILHGTVIDEPAGSMATPEDLPIGLIDGDQVLLPGDHVGITDLVLKDSTATTPVTLVEGQHYTFDGDSKVITFISVETLTQPIQVFSYSYAASDGVVVASKTPPDCAVLFDGINLAVQGEKIWARFDRVAFSPAATYALKSGGAGGTANEVAMYELAGTVMLKPGNVQSDGYGQIRTY
jgi:hypothetical protein